MDMIWLLHSRLESWKDLCLIQFHIVRQGAYYIHDQKAGSLTFEGQIREGNNRGEIIMHYFTIGKKKKSNKGYKRTKLLTRFMINSVITKTSKLMHFIYCLIFKMNVIQCSQKTCFVCNTRTQSTGQWHRAMWKSAWDVFLYLYRI